MSLSHDKPTSSTRNPTKVNELLGLSYGFGGGDGGTGFYLAVRVLAGQFLNDYF